MAESQSETRQERSLDVPLSTCDLTALLDQIKSENTSATVHRRAMILAKTEGLRVVVVALHAGTVIPLHRSDGAITVQTIEGQITFSAASQTVTFNKGQMLVQKGLEHSLKAIGTSAFLFTAAA